MDFNYIDEGINAVVIDNFYTEEQIKNIMMELKWLTKPQVLLGEDAINSAENEYGSAAKKSGIFLENVFINWRHSALISSAVTQLETHEFWDGLMNHNQLYKMLFYCNHRSHLLSYYEHADYYGAHIDASFFTILNYFHTEPKQWKGGEIVLSCIDNVKKATIETKHNRTLIICSNTYHEVQKLTSEIKEKYSGDGRYCNAIFLTRIDDKEWHVDPNGGGKYVDRKNVGLHTSKAKPKAEKTK